ncbi:hypothetical protein HW132_32375, partial [Brasilonema sp. CT11]|nr:hypothetical protein [Brasilonema sp. CT11]
MDIIKSGAAVSKEIKRDGEKGVVMQTLKQGFEERNLTMVLEAEKLTQYWLKRLDIECPEQSFANRESIVKWLVGSDLDRFEVLNSKEL